MPACQRCQRPLAAKGPPCDKPASNIGQDTSTFLVQRHQGKRRRDRRALSAPPGRRLVACTKSREGSFAVIGIVPKGPKDPLPFPVQRHQGKRRWDKRALSARPGRGLVACTKSREGSFAVYGAAPGTADVFLYIQCQPYQLTSRLSTPSSRGRAASSRSRPRTARRWRARRGSRCP